jgi:diguanylate cyclase (GGDEF)-like protein
MSRWLPRAYLLVSVILIGSYPLLPDLGRIVDHLVVSLGCMLPVVGALRRIKPGERRPWWLLLLALIAVNLGIIVNQSHHPVAADASWMLEASGIVLAVAGVVALILLRGRNDLGVIIDATIIALAVGGVLWDSVVRENLVGPLGGGAARTDYFVVVFALAGVLGALVRLAQTAKEVTALWTMTVAVGLALAGNVLLVAAPSRHVGAEIMFMGTYTTIGLFGFDPSAADLVKPGPTARREALSVGRLLFLGTAVAVIPVAAGARALAGFHVDGALLILGCGTIALLVMARIGLLSSAEARAQRELAYEAAHDPLTGLANRRTFVERLAEEISRGQQTVVLFCDLDEFKTVNDKCGHAFGDQLLVQIADRLIACARAGDLVSRFGGDEFLFLLTDATITDGEAVSQRIAQAVAVPVVLDDGDVTIGVSIGLAVANGAVDPERLIRRADRAMYLAKQTPPTDSGVRLVISPSQNPRQC